MTYRIVTTNELYHHGIKGQKWGVRRGDNYPLKPSEHSAAEKKAFRNGIVSNKKPKLPKSVIKDGYKKQKTPQDMFKETSKRVSDNAKKEISDLVKKKTNKSLKTDEKFDSNKLTDKQKKAIKVGAAVAGTILVTYGAYKLSQLNKQATKGLQKRDFDLANLNFSREEQNRNIASQMAKSAREAASSKDSATRLKIANENLKFANEAHNRGVERLKRAELGKYSLKDKYKYLRNG